MKHIKIVKAKRNRKPFITEYKDYIIIKENVTKYLVKNDLGKETWENQDDFWDEKDLTYGWDAKASLMPAFVTPAVAFVWDTEEREFYILLGLPFFMCGIGYTLKPKL